jgi:hypothetical protein
MKKIHKYILFFILVIVSAFLIRVYFNNYIKVYEPYNNQENISNVAFLIPIYPPHYHYLYYIIDKLKANTIKIDIILIFSSPSDYEEFQMKADIKPIIISEPINTKSIITFKKFFALKKLITSKYDYFICCDSEIDIIPENFTHENINNKITQIFNNKTIYAGVAIDKKLILINTVSADLFPSQYEILKTKTDNFTLYFWYSDLPVYRKNDLYDFLSTINYSNIVWEHFDYIIYQYYLILNHGFNITNTTPITNTNWSFERLYTDNIDILNKLYELNYGFSWNTKALYDINKNYIISKKAFIIYNLDREINQGSH